MGRPAALATTASQGASRVHRDPNRSTLARQALEVDVAAGPRAAAQVRAPDPAALHAGEPEIADLLKRLLRWTGLGGVLSLGLAGRPLWEHLAAAIDHWLPDHDRRDLALRRRNGAHA